MDRLFRGHRLIVRFAKNSAPFQSGGPKSCQVLTHRPCRVWLHKCLGMGFWGFQPSSFFVATFFLGCVASLCCVAIFGLLDSFGSYLFVFPSAQPSGSSWTAQSPAKHYIFRQALGALPQYFQTLPLPYPNRSYSLRPITSPACNNLFNKSCLLQTHGD